MAIVVLIRIMTTMMIYLVPDVLMSSIQTAGSPTLVPFNIQQRALEHSFWQLRKHDEDVEQDKNSDRNNDDADKKNGINHF